MESESKDQARQDSEARRLRKLSMKDYMLSGDEMRRALQRVESTPTAEEISQAADRFARALRRLWPVD